MNNPSDLHYFKPEWVTPTAERVNVDVCIYGGTSAGIIAAVETARQGKSVIIVHPGKILGGLTTGGLGYTDVGRKSVIGGLSREFYRLVGRHYGKDEEFVFEPSVASAVFGELLREHDIDVRLCQYIHGARKTRSQINSITLLGGLEVTAKAFIDATYEGDLMARAGISFFVGREANSVYGETLSGIQVRAKHQFSHAVDPYVEAGNPASGLLPGIIAKDLQAQIGQGDHRIQAYNFRMCMTDDPNLKIDWTRPANYDPQQYLLLERWLQADKDTYNDLLPGDGDDPSVPVKFDVMPNKTPGGYNKTDTNNHGAVSSDYVGANYKWPEGSYVEREQIFQAHVAYQKGLYWHMANAPAVPERYRIAMKRWGLPSDEFLQTGHWPHQLYVREARRMVGEHVITEHDCRGSRVAPDSIGMGSYGMDSHNCTRFVKIEGGRARVLNEGDVQVGAAAYPIPYRAITPQRGQCQNLLVPVCLSASHIAYGSARMEPVFMVLGQSAAIAISMAIDANLAVQDVDYRKLENRLRDADQVLTQRSAAAALAQ